MRRICSIIAVRAVPEPDNTIVSSLAVITNRGSTRNLRGEPWIDPLLAGVPGVTHFEMTHVEQLTEIMRRCAAAGVETIVVNGGDGTADLVFGELLNGDAYGTPPALALLPAGKTNMTAAAWSLTGKPEAAMRAVLEHHKANTLSQYAVSRPVLALERGGGAPTLYGAFFGAAEVVDGILFCRKHIFPLNLPNAVSHAVAIGLLLWRSLFTRGTSGAVQAHDSANDIENGKFFVVAVTALDELLLGLKPHSTETTGPLHYLSLRMGAGSILGAIPDVLRGRIAAGRGRTVRRADRITLRFTGAYTLDGELHEADAAQPLALNGSQRLRFIRLPQS